MKASSSTPAQFGPMLNPSCEQHPGRPSGDATDEVPLGQPKSGLPLLHCTNLHSRSGTSLVNVRVASTTQPNVSFPSYLYQSTSSGPAIFPDTELPLPSQSSI